MSKAQRQQDARYTPPWVDMSIIGVAGSSGSGKTSLAVEIVRALDLPWVIILSIDSFYKSLTPEQNKLAHANEYDLDSPESIDFDLLFEKLQELKQGKRVDMPVYSFAQHQRLDETVSLYSPHVVILEGILALNDPRILKMLDLKVFVEADADLCLSRRIIRDVKERGRTIEGVVKQWFAYVKPVYLKYVEPQRHVADLIVPRGMQNKVAISMIVSQIRQTLKQKSISHSQMLEKLGKQVEDLPLADTVHLLEVRPQIRGIITILSKSNTDREEFVFYMDRLAALLVEKALDCHNFIPGKVVTPQGTSYWGVKSAGVASAVVVLRGGSCLETGLKRSIPDCPTSRILIQSNYRTAEPELHYMKLIPDINKHETVVVLDSQMSSGGAALMAVKVLVDHGVHEKRIVFVTFRAGTRGLNRLLSVFPGVKVVAVTIGEDHEKRWIEDRSSSEAHLITFTDKLFNDRNAVCLQSINPYQPIFPKASPQAATMSLRIVPQASHATSTTNTQTSKLSSSTTTRSLGAPSAPGLPDTLRTSHVTSKSTPTSSSHPLETRLAQWQTTQQTLHHNLLRRNFGVALPLRMQMEQQMVRKADGFRPSALGVPSRVHEDILTGRDAEVQWEDVYAGQDGLRGFVDVGGDGQGVGWADEMEVKVGMGKW